MGHRRCWAHEQSKADVMATRMAKKTGQNKAEDETDALVRAVAVVRQRISSWTPEMEISLAP